MLLQPNSGLNHSCSSIEAPKLPYYFPPSSLAPAAAAAAAGDPPQWSTLYHCAGTQRMYRV
ncbi:hypothetical protein JYU34_003000 [Plutella xylostella]|uniref:Uncharacterized protein n=1 Tax=Plutella xylostella TaxID=51655 RepID=A0ABQ7R3S5_PLUXY|nr:hypothetical protein JYU34_003000 [Plutella xylostella]